MVNPRTGGWRRPWTASRGSLHQPAWPVQLSETPRKPTCCPLRAKAPLGHPGLHGLGLATTQQLPLLAAHRSIPPAGSSPRPHTALRSTASPCPQPRGGATYAPLGRAGLAAHPTLRLLFKTHGEPTLPTPLVSRSCWDRSGREMFRNSLPPLAFLSLEGTCPVPGGPALWKPRRFFPGVAWAVGTAALCHPESPGLK